MNVDVVVSGDPWKVAIEPAEQSGQFTVTIKGRHRIVDVSWVDADTLSLIEAGAAREVRFHCHGENGAFGVEVAGKLFEVVVPEHRGGVRLSDRVAGKNPPDPLLGAQAIKAPMPCRVVRLLVAVSDRVSAGQGVVVVEAMKMENELRSPRDGTVKEVGVAAGAAVEASTVLVVIGD